MSTGDEADFVGTHDYNDDQNECKYEEDDECVCLVVTSGCWTPDVAPPVSPPLDTRAHYHELIMILMIWLVSYVNSS